jgi:hypothetical protein
MECHLRVVGLVRLRNLQSSILKTSPTDRFPIPYLTTFSRIPQIYKPVTALPHHALFYFTRFAVKNSDT